MVSPVKPLHLNKPFTLQFPDKKKKIESKKIESLGHGTYKQIDEITFRSHKHNRVYALATPRLEPKQIKNECKISNSLRKNHVPHILKMKPVTVKTSKHEKQPGAVMECCQGKDLESYLHTHAPSADVRERLSREVVEAVTGMHAINQCHLDLKPGNVFVSLDKQQQPHIKLGDFGEVKKVNDLLSYGVGTFPAPEMRWAHDWRQAIQIRPSLDIYPLADILYSLRYGKSLLSESNLSWGNRSDAYTFRATAERVHQYVTAHLRTSVNPKDQCICQMYSVDPAQRPTSQHVREVFCS